MKIGIVWNKMKFLYKWYLNSAALYNFYLCSIEYCLTVQKNWVMKLRGIFRRKQTFHYKWEQFCSFTK